MSQKSIKKIKNNFNKKYKNTQLWKIILVGFLIIGITVGCVFCIFISNQKYTESYNTYFSDKIYFDMGVLNNLYRNIYSNNTITTFTDCNIREIGNCFTFKKNKYIAVTNYINEKETFINIINITNKQNLNISFNKIIDRPLEDPYIIIKDDIIYLFCEDKLDIPFKNMCIYKSYDLKNFIRIDKIIGPSNNLYESNDVSSPKIIKKGDLYWMLYEGRSELTNGCICLAYSKDLINWIKYKKNPIITGSRNNKKIKNNSTNVFHFFDHIVPDDIKYDNDKYIATFHVYCYNVDEWRLIVLYSYDLFVWYQFRKFMEIQDCDYGQGIMFINNNFYYSNSENNKLKLITRNS